MKKTNLIMRIVPLAVFAAIAVYLAVYIIRAVDDPFTTATATLYTVRDSTETRGIAVREEEWLIYSGGMVSITAEDGARVAAGGEIAAVYSSEEDIKNAERAAFLVSQAEYLEAYASGREAEAPIDYDARIKSLVRALRAETDMRSADEIPETALELQTLVFSSGEDVSIEDSIEALNAELKELGNPSSLRMTTIFAGRSGIFRSVVDGWETLTPEYAANLGAAQVESLLRESHSVPSTAVGKLIYGDTWYFLTLVPEAEAEALSRGDYLTVSFGRWLPEDVRMKIESKSSPENGQVALFLSSSRSLADAASLRVQTAEIIHSSYDGIRIPRRALHTDGTKDYVYVMTGLQAERKTVEILLDTGDFYIIRSEAARADAVHAGDVVIVTGKGLYDGKVVG